MQNYLITPLFTLLALRWLAVRYQNYDTIVGADAVQLQYRDWIRLLQRLIIYLEQIQPSNFIDRWILARATSDLQNQYTVAKQYLHESTIVKD